MILAALVSLSYKIAKAKRCIFMDLPPGSQAEALRIVGYRKTKKPTDNQ
jgi:hypothetical protein